MSIIRFISEHWVLVALPLDAPSLQRLRAVLEAVARGGPDAPEQLARALAWLTETEARLAPVPIEAPLAPLLRVSRMLAALDPAPGSTLPVDEHIPREALARALAWAAEVYAPFRAALEAALEADDPDAALPALAPPPQGAEAALAWLAIEPELAAVWCGAPAPEDVPLFEPELMLVLFVLHPDRPWVARVRSFWRERLGADPSAEAILRRPRLAARRVALVPTCERFRLRLAGHTGRVVSLLAHPSRPLLLSGSVYPDYTVRVWDLDARSVVRTLVGHTSNVYGLALCPDGKRLASGSNDNTVRLWDLDSGACLRTLAGHSSYVLAVAWEAAGSLVASGSYDKTVRLWHADSGALRHTLEGHSSHVYALAAHPADDLLASGSADKTVRVWRWSSGAHVRTLAGHTGEVRSLAASAAWLVSGSGDKSVRVWSWNGICARVLDGFAETLRLNSLAWRDSALVTLDGFAGQLFVNSLAWRDSALVTLENDGTVRVWDTGSPDPLAWSCVGSLKEKASSSNGVAVVGGGIVCAAPGDNTTIAVWAAE